MRRVGLMPERVQKLNVQALQLLQRLLRNIAEIRQVCGGADPVAVNLGFAVNYRYRTKGRAKQFKRAIYIDQFQLGNAPEFVVCLEDVAEHVAEKLRRLWPGIQRDLAGPMKAQGPEIVDTENMIRMGMGINNGINTGNIFPDSLLAEIGRGVNQD